MKNVEFKLPELKAIEPSKAQQIKQTFEPMAEMLEGFEKSFNEIMNQAKKEVTEQLTEDARRLRIDIAKVRIQAEKVRKAQKEEYLRAGKAIDGVSNILKWAVQQKEAKLMDVEKHFEFLELERRRKLQSERLKLIAPYVENANDRNYAIFKEDEFKALLAMKKKEYEEIIAAEKKAEEERIAKEKAEAEERERIRKENEQLRKERIQRQLEAEAERKERDEKERKEREAYEAKLKAERDEKEMIQRQLEAKAEAEKKAKEEEKARIEAELSKGDAAKVKDLIVDLSAMKTKYTFKSAKNQKMYADVSLLLEKIIKHIKG